MKRLTFHPRPPVRSSPRAVQGQALTEFLVIALALIPLLLLTPLIAKYQDVANAVQMASRYVTFEAMTRNDAQSTWKTPGQLAGEVQRRFFSNPDAPVKTGDVAGNFVVLAAHRSSPTLKTTSQSALVRTIVPPRPKLSAAPATANRSTWWAPLTNLA
jgi:hypothetical protein